MSSRSVGRRWDWWTNSRSAWRNTFSRYTGGIRFRLAPKSRNSMGIRSAALAPSAGSCRMGPIPLALAPALALFSAMPELGLNIDHVATLREARYRDWKSGLRPEPDVL